MSDLSVDVVIVSFNASEDLRDCLLSLRANHTDPPSTVTVVDNASSDGSAARVTGVLPHARIVALSENVGFARANNVGIRLGRNPFVLLLNSDTLVPQGSILQMVQELASDPGLAACGPRLVDTDGRPELSFGRMMSPWNELRQRILGALHVAGADRVDRLARLTTRPRRVDWVSGACLLVRREDAEAVGLLDERYFMYAEDVDFCASLRARRRGILFAPQIQIVHKRGRSRRAAPEATRAAYRRSQLAFYAKHHPRWYRWLHWYLRVKGALPDGL